MLFIAVAIKAQMAVTDPAGLAMQVKQLGESTKQTSEMITQGGELAKQSSTLLTSANYLKKSIQFVESVSSTIRDITLAKNVITKQVNLVSDCANLMTNLNKNNALRNGKYLSQNISTILAKNKVLTELLTKTLTPDMKMNDSERVTIMMEISNQTDDLAKLIGNIETTNSMCNSMYNIIKK